MADEINRRDFLKKLVYAGTGVAGLTGLALILQSCGSKSKEVQQLEKIKELEEDVAQLVKNHTPQNGIYLRQDSGSTYQDYHSRIFAHVNGYKETPLDYRLREFQEDHPVDFIVREFQGKKPVIVRVAYNTFGDDYKIFEKDNFRGSFRSGLGKSFFEDSDNKFTQNAIGVISIGRLNKDQRTAVLQFYSNLLSVSKEEYKEMSRNYLGKK